MLIGIPPFYSKNQKDMLSMIIKNEVKFPTNIKISEEAQDLIQKVSHITPMNFTPSFLTKMHKRESAMSQMRLKSGTTPSSSKQILRAYSREK